MTKNRSYKSDLVKTSTDSIKAKEYLNAALEDDNPEVFLLALQRCGSAQAIESDRNLDTAVFS